MPDEQQRKLQSAADKLFQSVGGNPRRLAMLAAQFQQAAGERPSGALFVVGGVSVLTGKPFVQFSWGDNRGQVDADTARSHAQKVQEAVANAVADAAILAWAVDELKVEREQAVGMIDAMRRYRSDRWGQPDLELEFEREPPPE